MDIKGLGDSIESLAGVMGGVAEKLDKQDERLTKIEDAQKREIDDKAIADDKKVEPVTRDLSVPGSDLKNDNREFSFLRAARGILKGDWRGAEFEREVFGLTDDGGYGISVHARDMSASNDSLGGYLVPNEILNSFFIELLRPNVITERLGATVMPNLSGSPVEIPSQLGGATAGWTGENQTIASSDLTVGQINLQPRQLSALVKMSSRLSRMSEPAAEALTRKDMALAIAERLDLAALRGSGASGEPIGIANTIGINTVALGANGGFFSFEKSDLMRQELAVDNALRGKLGFGFHPTIRGKLGRERIAQFSNQVDGAYVVLPMTNAEIGDRLGFKWEESTQIPTTLTKGSGSLLSEVYFADWSELMIGMWTGLELDASRQAGTAFETNQVWLKASIEADIALRHVESFCLISDAETV